MPGRQWAEWAKETSFILTTVPRHLGSSSTRKLGLLSGGHDPQNFIHLFTHHLLMLPLGLAAWPRNLLHHCSLLFPNFLQLANHRGLFSLFNLCLPSTHFPPISKAIISMESTASCLVCPRSVYRPHVLRPYLTSENSKSFF